MKFGNKKIPALLIIFGFLAVGSMGGYYAWIHFGFGSVPKFAVKMEVEHYVDTSMLTPDIGGFRSDGCGSTTRFQHISYINVNNDLYLVIKCKDDILFGRNVSYSLLSEGNFQINITVWYVDCIIKSAAYIFIPDIGTVQTINVTYYCESPEY